jgi:hypothetical protein
MFPIFLPGLIAVGIANGDGGPARTETLTDGYRHEKSPSMATPMGLEEKVGA